MIWVLTVRPPWSYAITHLGKDIENRSWPAPLPLVKDRWVAIHAGKSWDETAEIFLADLELSLPPRTEIPTGGIVAVCKLVGCYHFPPSRTLPTDRWAMPGHHCWQIRDVRRLPEVVPWQGRLGLTKLPDFLESRVQALIPAAA